MDMKRLLEKMDQFAGQAVGQKPGDQVRGTEKATKKKSGEHPFKGRLVGASESILKDLDNQITEGSTERNLVEEYQRFSRNWCGICGQSPCNCTTLAEAAGLYGPFTVTINTGERPQSHTKTKKFKREDDAILWAQDWLEDFSQYPFATAEVTDPDGNVVWTTDEEDSPWAPAKQGVAEGNRGLSKRQETEFHAKLDKLVHDTFGKREGEMAEEAVPPSVPTAGGPAGAGQQKQQNPEQAALLKKQQASMQQNLANLKTAGVDIDPAKAAQSLQKTDTGAPMNAMDKDTISKLAPALGNVMSNPSTASQLNTLIKKAGGGA